MNRVVITGIGAISPLGNSLRESWAAAKEGLSGITPITRFDVSGIKWKVAGEVKGFVARKYLARKEIIRLYLFLYAVAAAMMPGMRTIKQLPVDSLSHHLLPPPGGMTGIFPT
jgi:3-oxoacyl-[acyl-carrier-protein] synthase II